jgi:alpha-amylase
VQTWFKPLAYSLILLREAGYPCVFYPDLYGAHYVGKDKEGNDQEVWLEQCPHLEKLLVARKQYAYGKQRDYFDDRNCIGWTREGLEDQPGSGCAVILSNGDESKKRMEMGAAHAGKVFVDYLECRKEEIAIDGDGWAEFPVAAGNVSVWIGKESP